MSTSKRRVKKIGRVKRSAVAAILVATMALPVSPSQAHVTGARVKLWLDAATNLLRKSKKSPKRIDTRVKPRQIQSVSEREGQVTRLRLCPRRLLMYVGEEFAVSPLPLDSKGAPVHGVVFSWASGDRQIATVASDGTVAAVKNGQCVVTASVGQRQARVNVEVRDGARPKQTNAQWDAEHLNDCTDPEQDPVPSSASGPSDPQFGVQLLPPPDPIEPHNVAAGGARFNANGHPRFSPDLTLQSAPASTDNQMGSSSFHLSIPIFGSGGRGMGVDLSLAYNGRVWTKDPGTNTILFDYDQGWPAPGFRLNYGWIIRDYNVPTGSSGNYLLIEADGTRTPLMRQGSVYRSEDGRYLEFSSHNLTFPDGSQVKYTDINSRFLPVRVRDVHGNSIFITYVDRNAGSCSDAQRVEPCDCSNGCYKPPRQSINYITDTLGRQVTFYYYADGHLAEVRGPGYNGAPDRVLAKFYYQTITLSYNFSLTVSGVPGDRQVDVLRRVYFPETGTGYVFDSYSGYGMCTHVSMRQGMTASSDGTETGFTEYGFNTSGQLSDAPEFNQRREWWLHKTDDSGNDVGPESPATYTYSRTSNPTTMTNTIAGPSGPNSVTTVMVSNNSTTSPQYGLLTEQRHEVGGTVKLKQEFLYDDPSSSQGSSGLQRNRVTTTDDASPANQTRTEYLYGQYGRLITQTEYGFPITVGGNFKKRRRTEYSYLDTPSYISAALYHLMTFIIVWDAKETNDDSDDTKLAKTAFDYDNPDTGWEIQKYGFTQGCVPPACTPPPGYDTAFVDTTVRGLVTKVIHWSDATALPDINFRHQYDIFGNEVKAEVGCCSLKRFTFSPDTAGLFYSTPMSVTDGPVAGPNLMRSFAYDFNTSFLNSETDANNLVTGYAPDSAMRLKTVTYPKLSGDSNSNATLETFYVDAQNDPSGTDTLVYQSRFTYFDGTTQKVQISNQWLDGAERAIRAGSAAGPTISNFDAVKMIYDDQGRLRKSTNPYNTTSSDGNTTGLPNASIYDYDGISRVLTVTLPDTNTVTTAYNGAVTTVTDQVGRQRQSEVDGLGRVIRVTEMDGSKLLTWDTTYGYDKNDNLTSVNQGNQTRAFKFDSLSRMTFERTPEQDSTIDDGTGTFWSAKYTYTSSNAIATRQDPRGVVTTSTYDGLNRLSSVTYNTSSSTAQPTASVNVTYGSAVPKLGHVTEVKETDSSNNTPWKESYDYDTLSRTSSKTVSLDNQAVSYATGYGYNQAGQLKTMTYPSSRLVTLGYDSRGRLLSLGGTRSYITNVGFNPAQQTTSISLANGVNESYGYNAQRLQLTSQTAAKGANTLVNIGYNYNADQTSGGGTHAGNSGQLISMTAWIGGPDNRDQTFQYDQVGRLVYASGTDQQEGEWQRRYTYDRWGNRTKVERYAFGVGWCTKQVVKFKLGLSGQPLTNRPTTSQDYYHCTQVVSKAMLYDGAGNTTAYGAQKLLYDGESRLAQVLDDTGATVGQYSYDAANRRVKKLAGGATTNYVWEGSHVIAEYSGATGALIAEYVYAGARMLAEESGGTVKYYHQDRLSARVLTDVSGNIVAQMSHEPFGEQLVEREEVNKWRFTNYERDGETSSDYAVNRQYGTSTGRFMRPDPVVANVLDPQSLNRYAYVANDPVNSVDPLGLVRLVCFTVSSGPLRKSTGNSVVIGVTERTYCFLLPDFTIGAGIGDPFAIGGGRGGGGGSGPISKLPFRRRAPRKNPCPTVLPTIDPVAYLRTLQGGSGPAPSPAVEDTHGSLSPSLSVGPLSAGVTFNSDGTIMAQVGIGLTTPRLSLNFQASNSNTAGGVYIEPSAYAGVGISGSLNVFHPSQSYLSQGIGTPSAGVSAIGVFQIWPLLGSTESDIRRQREGHLGSSVGRCPY